jgi:hypothetical protein
LDVARIQADVLRDGAAAVTTLRQGLTSCGGERLIHLQLAERLASGGHVNEAVVEYQQLVHNDPTQADGWRGMARCLHDAGRKMEAGVALGPLVVLGEANAIESGMSRQRRVRSGVARVGSFDAAAIARFGAAESREEQRVTALLGAVAEGVGKLFPLDLERYGVSSRDRLVDHPLNALADRLAQVFGVEEHELYLHRSQARDIVVEVAQPTVLLVPRYINDLSEETQVFLLARAFAALSRGVHAALKLGARETERLLAASVQGMAPTYGINRFGGNDLGELYKRLHKVLSRKSRKLLETASQAYVQSPAVDFERWAAAIDFTNTRAAALLTNDLPASVEGLQRAGATPSGLDGPALVRATPVVADLFRFWTSPPADEQRRSAGIL